VALFALKGLGYYG